jgi:hypothetical protein
VQQQARKLFEIIDIQETLERIESNERKLEVICSRVDNLENLSSRQNINNNNDERSNDIVNSQEKTVSTFSVRCFYF